MLNANFPAEVPSSDAEGGGGVCGVGRMCPSHSGASRPSRGARALALGVLAAAFSSLGLLGSAQSQNGPLINRGDAVVTAFSGAKPDASVPADVHPLDKTFIDVDGNSAQVFDLSALGMGPRGQLADAPPKLQVKARDVGQVFGVTLDDGNGSGAPNAYLAATSRFGLQIVNRDSNGVLNRLLTGAPGATWMPGQFGQGGTPGSIWKVEGTTGAVSLLTRIKANGQDNGGTGLGNITFDDKTRQLFVSDLETGLIHRLTMDGQDLGTFDHGTAGRTAQGLDAVADDPGKRMNIGDSKFNSEDPATWGYAADKRRVFGLAVSNGRLYYSVAEGPSVWSVALDGNGGFGSDPRIELEIANAPAGTDITDILFDDQGRLYLSQRGPVSGSYDYKAFAAPQQSLVLRYTWSDKDGRWVETPEEYAIGLAPEHRETQGGIALNYGYDQNGNINYGACRQTLWTTGEHLREGEDAMRVSTGGAKIVHGLQGNYISRVRPANEPPYETWFTDYDGRFADADVYGHIGDVAIYTPCDQPQQQAYVPPADNPGLILDKQCYAGAIGGKVKCTISVKNVMDHVASDDIKIVDVTTILYGPGAGGKVPIVAFSSPLSAVICSDVPTPDFSCVIPAALLPANQSISIDVWVDTHDLVLNGNLGFSNCASLKNADGYGKACAQGGTDIVVEKIGPGTCLPGGTCKFGLKIANKGGLPFSGDLVLADAMTVGGAVKNAVVNSVSPPIACSAGDTNQLPFSCVTNVSLMPGEEHIHWIEVTMPAPGGYWAENCFGALDPALLPPGPLPPGLVGPGGAGNPSCVWVHVPVPVANLKIEKTAAGNGMCEKAIDGMVCKYDITFSNQNGSDFNQPLSFEEDVPAGSTIISLGAPFSCTGGPATFNCSSGGPLLIPAGNSLTTQVAVKVPFANVEALQCKVQNTVKILQPPGGAAPNLDAGDDQSSALASMKGLELVDPQTQQTKVFCDPTNLKVTKVANGDCKKAPGGWRCGYDITLLNTGPDPYKGPVKIEEKIDGKPTDVSFKSQDFTCSGGGADFKCETAPLTLVPNGELHLTVDATIPDDGTCRLANTVSLVAPVAGSKGNGDGADDEATAIAHVASAACRPPQTLIPVDLPSCDNGRPRRADGTCPCPLGWGWSPRRQVCEPPRRECLDPARRMDDGGCCPFGTYYDDRSGICRTPPQVCGDPERRRGDGSCCPIGSVVGTVGDRCVVIDTVCPYGTRWNYILRTCLPVKPICSGYYNWRTRECEPIRKTCQFGMRWDIGQRECVPIRLLCQKGERWDPMRHTCVGWHDGDNDKPCRDGMIRINGRCMPKPIIDIVCPEGKHRVGKFCVPNRTGGGDGPCGPGKHRVGKVCVPDTTDGDQGPCGSGKHRVGKYCVPDRNGADDNGPCEKGKHHVGQICVPDRTDGDQGPCGPGKHRVGKFCLPDSTGPGGNVLCEKGKHRAGNACVDDVIKLPNPVCSQGQHLVGKTCVPDATNTPSCPPGKHAAGRTCVPDIVKQPGGGGKVDIGACPAGQHRVGRACVPNITKPNITKPVVPVKPFRKPDPPAIKFNKQQNFQNKLQVPKVRAPQVKPGPKVFAPGLIKKN